jgi:hypothetical protein
MAAGDLVTLPWQLELNGVLFGSGTSFVVREFDPWAAAEVRQGELARAQTDGSYPGQDRLGVKLVSARMAITAATDVLEQAARRTLAGAWKPPAANATVPLVWMEDDGVKYALYGKPRLASTQLAPRLYTDARFVATDPRIYTAASLAPSTTFPTGGTGGLSFSAAAPFVFSGAGAGGSLDCTNSGTYETPYTITITGPVVAPVVEHSVQGRSLSFTGTIAAGESLVIDSRSRTVLLNGTASRYSWLTTASQWFTLEPGPNAIRFSGASGSGSCSIRYAPAWL